MTVYEVLLGFIAFYMCLVNFHISRQLNKSIEDKFKDQNEWLFESLYQINKGVLKPKEKPVEKIEKALVYNPNKDGMTEFKGKIDDFS